MVPASTIDAVTLILQTIISKKESCQLVQVGACDGALNDPVSKLIRENNISSILIEPIPASFAELKKNYLGVENAKLCNAAISNQSGVVQIYTTKMAFDELGRQISQVSSFNKNHLLKHHIREKDIISIEVEALTLEDVIKRYAIDKIDVLQIDAEGFDDEIVKCALCLKIKPKCIAFENIHLSQEKQITVLSQAKDLGYSWIHDKWNTVLVDASVIE